MFAGQDTTATTLQWVLYFLGNNPEWASKISDEFDKIGQEISGRNLKNVPITEACIKETLRLAHVIDFYMHRIVKQDVSFWVFLLEKNLWCDFSSYLVIQSKSSKLTYTF